MIKNITLVVFIALVLVNWLIKSNKTPDIAKETGVLKVHYIDVGQADCTLIKTDSAVMLIDGGNTDDSAKITGYLRNNGVEKIDIVIATHPHEDHIGGLAEIIRKFEIGKIYMPKAQANTAAYERLLRAVQEKGLKITTAKAGTVFELDHDTKCEIYSPIKDMYEEINSYSVVLKMTYGHTTFLFTGDIGTDGEFEMMEAGFNLNADVLKVAHHGSKYSSSEEFLKAVTPEYAIIFVGANNDYYYPHEKAMERLDGAKVYRTDLSGTIVITSDGEALSIKEEK
ncbi:MAG: ComEC/Rec2 family competence protein [Eubacteriales bacterium]|nr:ComEC/Rec2 family competence protein [Eubacteriales bacterium]